MATRKDVADELSGLIDNLNEYDRRQSRKNSVWNKQMADRYGDSKRSTSPKGKVFRNFGEQLQAVAMSSKPGAKVDSRLYEVRGPSGLSESVPSDGGFLVEQTFADDMFESAMDTGVVAKLCRRIPMGERSNRLTINAIDETSRATGSRGGQIQAYWAGEATEATASKPVFRQIELRLHKLIGLAYATEELLDDFEALGSVISEAFREEFSFVIDDSIIWGNGAGQPLGIMNSGCVVLVAKEGGQPNNTVVFNNLTKMYARLLARTGQNSAWLINKDVLPELLKLSMEGTTSGIVAAYLPAGGLSGKPYSTLLGLPLIPCEQCSSVGALGDVILGNFNRYLLTTKDMKSSVSVHVRFLFDELTYKFTVRLDGSPFLRKAITPYKGSNTMSDFITLAARTA